MYLVFFDVVSFFLISRFYRIRPFISVWCIVIFCIFILDYKFNQYKLYNLYMTAINNLLSLLPVTLLFYIFILYVKFLICIRFSFRFVSTLNPALGRDHIRLRAGLLKHPGSKASGICKWELPGTSKA